MGTVHQHGRRDYVDPQAVSGLNLYAYCNGDPVNFSDPTGHFVLAGFGIGAIIGIVSAATVLGGAAQLISNAIAGKTGDELWRGVAGAALGAGANALALCLPGGSIIIGALVRAAIQTGVDTLETSLKGEDISAGQTALNFGFNFATTLVGNWLGSKLVPIDTGLPQPQSLFDAFMQPYGQKSLMQAAIGAGVSGTVNFARNFAPMGIRPVVTAPMTAVHAYFGR